MDCIPYINDLKIEIDILKDLEKKVDKQENQIIIHKQIEDKQNLLIQCKNNLSKLSANSIEYRLYLKLLNGLNPSRAVEEIANENYMNDINPSSVPSIWRVYTNLKKIIKI